jgi:putative ABC transport system substrate-binding protein
MEYAATDDEGQSRARSFSTGLERLGWLEGRNLRTEWRWTGGDSALYDRYATELVSLNPEVLVAAGSLSVNALRQRAKEIPIVFVNVTDPVGQGFAKSLARPGGNITGFSVYDPPMVGKWLEMLSQITPPLGRVAILFNPDTPYAGLYLKAINEAAPKIGVMVYSAPCRDDYDIDAMLADTARRQGGGFLVLPSVFTDTHRNAIVSLAASKRLPAVYPYRFFAVSGGLMSYGVDQSDLYHRSAAYVDQILRGAKPADLPVQAPTKFEMILNRKSATALGVAFPSALLARADEVIE